MKTQEGTNKLTESEIAQLRRVSAHVSGTAKEFIIGGKVIDNKCERENVCVNERKGLWLYCNADIHNCFQ